MERFNFKATGRALSPLRQGRVSARWLGRVIGVAPLLPGSLRIGPQPGISCSATRVRQFRHAAGLDPSLGRAAPSESHLSGTTVGIWREEQRTPQDTWFAIEDLWLRMASRHPIQIDVGRGGGHLVFGMHAPAVHEETKLLRTTAQQPAVYAWQFEGQRGSFVRSITFEGDDLVVTVTSIPALSRWPDGGDLGWQVKGLFARLRLSQAGRSTTRYTAGASRTETSTFNTAASDSRLSTEMFVTPRSSCDTYVR